MQPLIVKNVYMESMLKGRKTSQGKVNILKISWLMGPWTSSISTLYAFRTAAGKQKSAFHNLSSSLRKKDTLRRISLLLEVTVINWQQQEGQSPCTPARGSMVSRADLRLPSISSTVLPAATVTAAGNSGGLDPCCTCKGNDSLLPEKSHSGVPAASGTECRQHFSASPVLAWG